MNNILVPIDLSPSSEGVFALACLFAKRLECKLWLIHVAAPDPDFVGYGVGPQYVREQRADELRKEHVDLQSMAKRAGAHGISAEALLVQGPTAETLVKESERLQADLVVMGSHGHGALYSAVMGSTSQQVLRDSRVPVLVVPSSREA